MIDCISVDNMRQSDAYTIAHHIDSLELMRRAAYGVFLAVDWKGSAAIIVGSGNNGGDGFALACILHEHNLPCTVFTLSSRFSDDSSYYAKLAKDLGVCVQPFEDNCLNGYDIVVDCLLGTGFVGSLRDSYRSAIDQINASSSYVVSVDINSGMNGDTGDAELAVISDLTVTIGYVKRGMVTNRAGIFIKRLVCANIGIVLLKEEEKISEQPQRGRILCPPWLDMQIIDVTQTCL